MEPVNRHSKAALTAQREFEPVNDGPPPLEEIPGKFCFQLDNDSQPPLGEIKEQFRFQLDNDRPPPLEEPMEEGPPAEDAGDNQAMAPVEEALDHQEYPVEGQGELPLLVAPVDIDYQGAMVIGHSFVVRLFNKIRSNMSANNTSMKEELGLGAEGPDVTMHGISGGQITDLRHFIRFIKCVQPRVVCIDIGSNDLCNLHTNGQQAIDTLRDSLREVQEECDFVMFYVLFHITERSVARSGQKSLYQYNIDVRDYNKRLVALTRTDISLGHWRHRGLLNPETPITTDGVHPNTEDGIWKYQKSVRNAILWATKQADDLEFVE